MLTLALLPSVVVGQSFSDYDNVGQLEESRREPSDLTVLNHTFKPSINYKLFGITTPHVFGAAGFGWNDNVLRQDLDGPGTRIQRRWFAPLVAGARLDTDLSDHRLELEYRVRVTEYWETGSLDTLEHQAQARLDLFFVDVEGHVDASWARRSYPQSIQLRGIVDLEETRVRAWGEARFGRFGVRVGGSFSRIDYLLGELDDLDSRTYGADVQVYGRITPKLRALVEYNLTFVEYEEGRRGTLNDYVFHQLRAGVDGTITPKLTVSLKLGGGYQTVRERIPVDNREFTGIVGEASVRYDLFPRTQGTVYYSHLLSPSVASNFLSSHDMGVRLTQKLFDEKVAVTGSFGYTRAKIRRSEHLNRLRAGLSITYAIRQWLSVGGEYRFVNLRGEGLNDDYIQHVFLASVGIGL